MKLRTHLELSRLIRKLRPKLKDYKQKILVEAIRSILDDDYHSIINDDEFKKLGHIYYGKKERG